jgi:hypothetical protein
MYGVTLQEYSRRDNRNLEFMYHLSVSPIPFLSLVEVMLGVDFEHSLCPKEDVSQAVLVQKPLAKAI